MKNILAITRSVVRLATSLHLVSLSASIKVAHRKVTKAVTNSNNASHLVNLATDALATAREARRDANLAERAAKTKFNSFVAAARAEADMLALDHSVG